ncbi:hypothetical protein SPRG_17446 [Saprolegnia parasitica CBS 223.65]|uniref:PX domain-containing protein n=1 Tax=Saprolegnia parasitica (strain CBS 223.65) TaxID=695850 RepID=A0A067BKB2_SAPPC|nr:hypothetical protein SPRG_17446 [Saprolegnia parasitica CBS 223.65]KDO17155.1 hypothetical protein SPRG_17446 [Saprolegnia parasitica CBS 223.65]|eukprot:XP_012212138.1 hypothetical protein SPRG_17446 [Saprolegnia parasitica CBS 223.65]
MDSSLVSPGRPSPVRAEILRSVVRLPPGQLKPSRKYIVFVLKVSTACNSYRIIERTWSECHRFEDALLKALRHDCAKRCTALWAELEPNVERSTRHVGFRNWCKIQLHHHTPETIAIFLEHYQVLLDAMLALAAATRCSGLDNIRALLSEFLSPPTKCP